MPGRTVRSREPSPQPFELYLDDLEDIEKLISDLCAGLNPPRAASFVYEIDEEKEYDTIAELEEDGRRAKKFVIRLTSSQPHPIGQMRIDTSTMLRSWSANAEIDHPFFFQGDSKVLFYAGMLGILNARKVKWVTVLREIPGWPVASAYFVVGFYVVLAAVLAKRHPLFDISYIVGIVIVLTTASSILWLYANALWKTRFS